MKPSIIHASNFKEMEKISNRFMDNKFKINSRNKNYILLKKRRYGNTPIHLFFIFIAFFFFYAAIFVNIVYFAYSFIWKSPYVLITTDNKDHEGNPLEFDNIDKVIEKANSLL